MLILSGISGDFTKVRVFDTEDKTNDTIYLRTLSSKLKDLMAEGHKIYGLQLLVDRQFYPPDSQKIPSLGVVLVPSEAKAALQTLKERQTAGS